VKPKATAGITEGTEARIAALERFVESQEGIRELAYIIEVAKAIRDDAQRKLKNAEAGVASAFANYSEYLRKMMGGGDTRRFEYGPDTAQWVEIKFPDGGTATTRSS